MSKIRKRRETSADITILRKTDNARLAGINVIKTQPVVILPLSRIPRQDSIGVREDLTTTELSSGGRIGKHQVLILIASVTKKLTTILLKSATKHQMFRSKMDSSVPFPASPVTSPDLNIQMGAGQRPESGSPSPYSFPVEPPSARNTPSPSIMTQTPETLPPRTSSPSITTHTPLESRSLNSSNSKDSSGGQPLSENLDSKGCLCEDD